MNNVVPMWRPKTFTSAEAMLEEVRDLIHADKRHMKVLAQEVGVSPQTLYNIRIGHTRWPRATTLFPLLNAMGYTMSIRREGKK